jgi:hypothetical protein
MLLKNLPKNKLFSIIFIRLCLDGLAGIQFILKGKFSHCFAILKAHFYFYSMIFNNLKKRGIVQNQNYYYTQSIIYNYFIKDNKKIS